MRGVLPASIVALVLACGTRTELLVLPTPSDSPLANACIRAFSCKDPERPPRSVSFCIWENRQHPDSVDLGGVGFNPSLVPVNCLNGGGGNCTSIESCLGPSGPCSGSSSFSGTTVLTSVAGRYRARDCAVSGSFDVDPGGTCMLTETEQKAVCGFGSCDIHAPLPGCTGTAAFTWDDGVLQHHACSGDEVCVTTPFGGECAGTGPPCSQIRCDGSDLIDCPQGHESRVRCADSPIAAVCGDPCYAWDRLGTDLPVRTLVHPCALAGMRPARPCRPLPGKPSGVLRWGGTHSRLRGAGVLELRRIGVGRPAFGSGPPPSEPDGRFPRIRLSSQWAPCRDRPADALAVVIVNSPSFAK